MVHKNLLTVRERHSETPLAFPVVLALATAEMLPGEISQ